jgi:VanZ family protein
MFKTILLLKNNYLLVSTVILFAITALSLTPLAHLPAAPGSDKAHHFIAYGALFFPVALARPKHWLWIALFFALWSGAIELIQPYVNRYGELLDMVANCTGLFCGYLMALITNKAIKEC